MLVTTTNFGVAALVESFHSLESSIEASGRGLLVRTRLNEPKGFRTVTTRRRLEGSVPVSVVYKVASVDVLISGSSAVAVGRMVSEGPLLDRSTVDFGMIESGVFEGVARSDDGVLE